MIRRHPRNKPTHAHTQQSQKWKRVIHKKKTFPPKKYSHPTKQMQSRKCRKKSKSIKTKKQQKNLIPEDYNLLFSSFAKKNRVHQFYTFSSHKLGEYRILSGGITAFSTQQKPSQKSQFLFSQIFSCKGLLQGSSLKQKKIHKIGQGECTSNTGEEK